MQKQDKRARWACPTYATGSADPEKDDVLRDLRVEQCLNYFIHHNAKRSQSNSVLLMTHAYTDNKWRQINTNVNNAHDAKLVNNKIISKNLQRTNKYDTKQWK